MWACLARRLPSGRLGDQLRIYLGAYTPEETSGRLRPKMHSKVDWVGGQPGQATIFVGSHNWTRTALDGVNMEASVRLECREDEQFARDVKAHLDGCFAQCVVFDPDDLDYYRAIQHALYPESPRRPYREAINEFA